jgi:16S rRNA (cytosine1402-N4)-methyltransferase
MHEPVLLHEVIDGLDIKDGDTVLDMTLGAGGHSAAILDTGKNISLIGIDQDDVALLEAKKKLGNSSLIIKGNFRDAEKLLAGKKADKILFDLGVSSMQLDDASRGFSFRNDAPLSMKMSDATAFSASDVVNGWSEEDIANVIFAYGEERKARTIAKAIVSARNTKRIETTFELATIIERTIGKKPWSKTNPATKTFQALRIAVNDELGSLRAGLAAAARMCSIGGRIAVISFHSLEDRIVKNFMKDKAKMGWKIITKKPIVGTEEEISSNPRSRSAKLRIIQTA